MTLAPSHRFDRRQLLLMMAGISAALAAGRPCEASASLESWLLRPDGPADGGLRAPHRTGELSKSSLKALVSLHQAVGEVWNYDPEPAPGAPGLEHILQMKTSQEPSYLAEYEEAVAILARLERQMPADLAMARLLQPANTRVRLGRIQKWVCHELMTWQVVAGGFRSFGYSNYRGFAGGSFTDPLVLPYRGIQEV